MRAGETRGCLVCCTATLSGLKIRSSRRGYKRKKTNTNPAEEYLLRLDWMRCNNRRHGTKKWKREAAVVRGVGQHRASKALTCWCLDALLKIVLCRDRLPAHHTVGFLPPSPRFSSSLCHLCMRCLSCCLRCLRCCLRCLCASI